MGTVEKRGKNSWRIATQIKVRGEWEWVRMTLRMDPDLLFLHKTAFRAIVIYGFAAQPFLR